MTNVGRAARIAALTVVALALTCGVASAASASNGTKGSKPSVSGTVSSVDGVTTPGTCGTSDNNGVFTVSATTVTVTPSTAFVEHMVASPTFANVCVGDVTQIIGDNVDNAMTALAVAIHVPKSTHVLGSVTAVNGDSTQGTCGTAGASGNFTLVTIVDSVSTVSTVYVSDSTVFTERKVPGASFADICVGTQAEAVGPTADGAVVATSVTIHPPKSIRVRGVVASVNGDSTPAACGTAGTAGGFTVQSTNHGVTLIYSVAVTTSTAFAEANVPSASFANLCVGGRALAIGTSSSGTLTADAVAVYPPKKG
ncbi:MAG: hypothetical protein ABSF84_16425 [Acidimicrobiales bacterium]|jgi:hypothetical protein